MKLFLLTDAREVDKYLACYRSPGGAAERVIACSHDAAFKLECEGVGYACEEDYFWPGTNISYQDELSSRVVRWVRACDRILASTCQGRLKQLRLFERNAFWFKVMFDGIAWRSRALRLMLERERPSEVVYFSGVDDGAGLPFQLSPYRLIAGDLAASLGIGTTALPAPSIPYRSKIRDAAVRAWRHLRTEMRALVGLMPPGDHLRRRGAQLPDGTGTGDLLVLSTRFDLATKTFAQGAAPSLRRIEVLPASRWRLSRFRQEARAQLDRAWHMLKDAPELRELFFIEELDLFPHVEQKVRTWLVTDGVAVAASYLFFLSRWAKGRARAFIASTLTVEPWHAGAAEAARVSGLPVAIFQHGGFVGYVDGQSPVSLELPCTDFYFCYGPGVAANLARECAATWRMLDCEPIAVGSPRLADLQRQLASKPPPVSPVRGRSSKLRRQVLYCSSHYASAGSYVDGLLYPSIAHLRARRAILRAIVETGDHAVYKPLVMRGQTDPLVVWAPKMFGSRVTVSLEPFTTEMQRCDVVVIDLASTPLLEALLTDLDVIVLFDARWQRVNDVAFRKLRKRAFVCTSVEDLCATVKAYAAGRIESRPDRSNTDFLRDYGLPVTDQEQVATLRSALERVTRKNVAHSAPSARMQ